MLGYFPEPVQSDFRIFMVFWHFEFTIFYIKIIEFQPKMAIFDKKKWKIHHENDNGHACTITEFDEISNNLEVE